MTRNSDIPCLLCQESTENTYLNFKYHVLSIVTTSGDSFFAAPGPKLLLHPLFDTDLSNNLKLNIFVTHKEVQLRGWHLLLHQTVLFHVKKRRNTAVFVVLYFCDRTPDGHIVNLRKPHQKQIRSGGGAGLTLIQRKLGTFLLKFGHYKHVSWI